VLQGIAIVRHIHQIYILQIVAVDTVERV